MSIERPRMQIPTNVVARFAPAQTDRFEATLSVMELNGLTQSHVLLDGAALVQTTQAQSTSVVDALRATNLFSDVSIASSFDGDVAPPLILPV